MCATHITFYDCFIKTTFYSSKVRKTFRRTNASKPKQSQIKPTPCLLFTFESIKNCHTEMNDVTVFLLSVNKRFDLLAQKHGDYHLRTVKRNVGNNSRKKSLLEVHACLISEPK